MTSYPSICQHTGLQSGSCPTVSMRLLPHLGGWSVILCDCDQVHDQTTFCFSPVAPHCSYEPASSQACVLPLAFLSLYSLGIKQLFCRFLVTFTFSFSPFPPPSLPPFPPAFPLFLFFIHSFIHDRRSKIHLKHGEVE